MNLQKILNEVADEVRGSLGKGSVANYIPALAIADPTKFAMALATVEGELFSVGDAEDKFSIQSISKVFALTQAFGILGGDLWRRVERENAGSEFNSLLLLELGYGIPRNPLTNAGAIVTTDIILTEKGKETKAAMLEFLRERSGNASIGFNEEIAHLEIEHGHRTKAIAHLIASFKNLENHPQTVAMLYFYQCAMEASCADLARSLLFLANKGECPVSKKRVISASQAKRINSILLTCGHYDVSGDFAFRIGLPGKSCVSGAIVVVAPGKMALAAWSPALNKDGVSLAASEALEIFAHKTGLSIF
ncbi:MAG: glutaminase [Helicobacteraceae bacterium]|jgi:glutaminase|nr:glutaminase [Helicobacteraceae bacterium]